MNRYLLLTYFLISFVARGKSEDSLVYPLHAYDSSNSVSQDDDTEIDEDLDTSNKSRGIVESDISIHSYDSQVQKKFRPNFKTNYKGSEFQYEAIVHQSSLWESFKRWVIRLIRDLFGTTDPIKAGEWFDNFVHFLAFLIIGVVIYFIAKALLHKEGTWIFRGSKNRRIDYTDLNASIDKIDFQKLIEKAKLENDHRTMVRYYHIWILRTMAERNHIVWDINKTNSDYFYEIKDKKIKEQFRKQSYLYDYIWYGEFEIKEDEAAQAERHFVDSMMKLDT